MNIIGYMDRDKRIGGLIERKYEEMKAIKLRSGWGRKLKGAGYMRHRDSEYRTEVPRISVHDASAKSYLMKYEAGLCGYLLPEDSEWARLVRPGSAERRAVASFEKSEEETLEAIGAMVFEGMTDSNFYSANKAVGTDRDVFGFGVMYVEDGWDSGERGIVYRCIDPQECVLGYSSLGLCEVFIRKTYKSAIDVVRDYGKSYSLERTRAKLAGTSEEVDVEVFEAVLPREYLYDSETEGFVEFRGNRPFVHIVYIKEDEAIVVESGYDAMPVFADVRNLDPEKMPYGEGLIEMCLPEILKLDDLANQRQLIRQKNADPPMYIPNSLKGRYSGKARAENYGPPGGSEARPSPIVTSLDANGYTEDIEEIKRTLRNMIPVDLFETLMGSTDSRKTATEVQMRKNEAMILLAMSIGDMKRNLIEPVFKRSARIIVKHLDLSSFEGQGNPERIREHLYALIERSRLELSSVFIRRLNAYLQNEGDDAVVQSMMALMQVYPQTVDVVDMDRFIQKYFLGKGLSASFIQTEEQIRKLRDARAEIQQGQLEAQNNQMQAKANADNAKAESLMGNAG